MANKVVVYSYVVGDLFHYGHLNHLRQAKELGDYLIVGVLTDEAVKTYKRKPIIPFRERIEIINQIKYVNFIMVQDELIPIKNIESFNSRFPSFSISILVHSHDSNENPIHWQEASKYMESIGKKAVRLEYYPHQSTTRIIEKIKCL